MNILVVRHGDASRGMKDFARPLSEKGQVEIDMLGKVLANEKSLKFKAILHSPLKRAVQTAGILSNHLKVAAYAVKGLKPGDEEGPALEHALAMDGEKDSTILIVGHLPNLHSQCALLTGCSCNVAPFMFDTGSAFMFIPSEREHEPMELGHHRLLWALHAGCHCKGWHLPSKYGCLFLLADHEDAHLPYTISTPKYRDVLMDMEFLTSHNLSPMQEFPATVMLENIIPDGQLALEESTLVTGSADELNRISAMLLGKCCTITPPVLFSPGSLGCLARHSGVWGFGWLVTPNMVEILQNTCGNGSICKCHDH